MSLDPALVGRQYPAAETFLVGREAVRDFAAAVGADHPWHHDVDVARAAGYPDLVAPLTYAVVVAQRSEARFVTDPVAAIDFTRVVHGEESFTHHHPIVAGDELTAELTVDAVRAVGGHTMVTTRSEIATVAGQPRCTVVSTLVVRSEESS